MAAEPHARPSSPSARLTPFEDAAMTAKTQSTNRGPRAMPSGRTKDTWVDAWV